MSSLDAKLPTRERKPCRQPIVLDLVPRLVDQGSFSVQRVLPSSGKRTVGPFVFWDQIGPGELLSGQGLDVRPHPHICLSTMTYLFQSNIEHRDTLGTAQILKPGDVNLMTAGRGIVHSLRTPANARLEPQAFFGIQCWLALPLDKEETNPSFTHYDKQQIPSYEADKHFRLRVIAGDWLGLKSPVSTLSDAIFVENHLKTGAQLVIPPTIEERAIYLLNGDVMIDRIHYGPSRMLLLKPGITVTLKALTDTHCIILGGSALEGPRYLWWNFVASSEQRIEQAKQDWQSGAFGKIPGDDMEFIPLPD